MSIIYVNSTLPVRRAMRRDGRASPLHFWGYEPQPGDVALAHRLNRAEITLRAKLGGLDLPILARTCWHLARGSDGVMLVTQPDLWAALPWLRRRFPAKRFVVWVWTDWEVDAHFASLAACNQVLCLTPQAKARLDARGLGDRATYVVWGCDPRHYQLADAPAADMEVFVSGLTQRDTALMHAALAARPRRTLLLDRAGEFAATLPAEVRTGLSALTVSTEAEMVSAYQRCRVCWIPLLREDRYLAGFTNLIESLLCGTAVVLSDCTRIPSEHLSLPGVFLHRTGDLADFQRATDAALEFSRAPGRRAQIIAAAAAVFHGRDLERTIRRAFGAPLPV